jgi:hypothetical protein
MASVARRVNIGFEGGQVLSVRLGDRSLQALYDALGKDGWQLLEGEDGPVRIDVARVQYVSAEGNEPHVGFG